MRTLFETNRLADRVLQDAQRETGMIHELLDKIAGAAPHYPPEISNSVGAGRPIEPADTSIVGNLYDINQQISNVMGSLAQARSRLENLVGEHQKLEAGSRQPFGG